MDEYRQNLTEAHAGILCSLGSFEQDRAKLRTLGLIDLYQLLGAAAAAMQTHAIRVTTIPNDPATVDYYRDYRRYFLRCIEAVYAEISAKEAQREARQ